MLDLHVIEYSVKSPETNPCGVEAGIIWDN